MQATHLSCPPRQGSTDVRVLPVSKLALWLTFVSLVGPPPFRVTADGVQHVRVQAGGKEPGGPGGHAGPYADGYELCGGAATDHERLQVCKPRRRHPVSRERQCADLGFWKSMIYGFGVGVHGGRFDTIGTAPMLGSKRSDNTSNPLSCSLVTWKSRETGGNTQGITNVERVHLG